MHRISADVGAAAPSPQGEWLETAVVWIARAIEAIGVTTIAVAVVLALVPVLRRRRGEAAYPLYRRHLGHGLLLGLEFLVAADIIRTVSHVPTLPSVIALAIVVLIRTFLSVTIQVEIDGRWPWRRSRAPSEGRSRAPSEGSSAATASDSVTE